MIMQIHSQDYTNTYMFHPPQHVLILELLQASHPFHNVRLQKERPCQGPSSILFCYVTEVRAKIPLTGNSWTEQLRFS